MTVIDLILGNIARGNVLTTILMCAGAIPDGHNELQFSLECFYSNSPAEVIDVGKGRASIVRDGGSVTVAITRTPDRWPRRDHRLRILYSTGSDHYFIIDDAARAYTKPKCGDISRFIWLASPERAKKGWIGFAEASGTREGQKTVILSRGKPKDYVTLCLNAKTRMPVEARYRVYAEAGLLVSRLTVTACERKVSTKAATPGVPGHYTEKPYREFLKDAHARYPIKRSADDR